MSSQSPTALRSVRTAELLRVARERILVLDGATGTALQAMNLQAEDFGGEEFEGCNEHLVLSRPDVVARVHEMYLDAGCDIVESNSFGSTPLVLNEYGIGHKAYELNKRAAEIARATCARFDRPGQTRFVAGSVGPTTKALSVTGGATFDELVKNFEVQAAGLFDGGVDYFLVETCQDTLNIKSALVGIENFFAERGERIPVAVSATIENSGTMLAGQSIEALLTSLENHDLFYLGLNCATGPAFMTDHIRSLAKMSPFNVACLPNAGLPDENGNYLETPEMVGSVLEHFIKEGWINFIGGCCGTHAGHVREFARLAKKYSPRVPSPQRSSTLSGVDFLEITDEMRPVLVGERTNVIGSKRFKDLITSEKFDEASEIAKLQVKAGAQIIDICLANPDRDELNDMDRFMAQVSRKVRAPLMIDSTDTAVIKCALTYCQGKSIINSINLEDGEERFAEIAPLAKKYGAALVVGTIDEDPTQGMAVSKERKLAIAERAHSLLTQKYGIPEEDIYFDALVFPCATGDEQYRGSAAQTIDGIKLIKTRFPRCKTILGISNVSFGLPTASREVLNSVFLYHCVQAGLDLAIANSEKLERYSSLGSKEIELALDLLLDRHPSPGHDPIAAYVAFFATGTREKKSGTERAAIPFAQRLALGIVEGTKEGLITSLDEALLTLKPLEIINGPLMAGMDEVGRLFNANKLIVAEVLQSAEVMKAAVFYLELRMEKQESSYRGKVLLATVKGDVHDIGKNLVEIILSNNGYKVINLGIKVPPEQILAAVREHEPNIIGLSGLLVKSAHQMVTTAEDLARAGITTPMLVGGAALSKNFTEKRILPAYGEQGVVLYAKDAMTGLDLAQSIMNPQHLERIKIECESRRNALSMSSTVETIVGSDATGAAGATKSIAGAPALALSTSSIRILESTPAAPDYDRHIQTDVRLEDIWKYINPLMLYTRHLGVKAKSARRISEISSSEDPATYEVWKRVEEIKNQFYSHPALRPKAVYQYFAANSIENSIKLYSSPGAGMTTSMPNFGLPGGGAPSASSQIGQHPKRGSLATFTFARQSGGQHLCLADFVVPEKANRLDNLALFLTSVGENVRDTANELKDRGEYLKSHVLQALAIETAEAYAEYLHAQLRASWGYADSPQMTMMDRFQAKYHGRRFSFGYPACPRLEDQSILFDLLAPQDIGVNLTEGFMMDPESSVSAIVFHHPDATYFAVGSSQNSSNDDENSSGEA